MSTDRLEQARAEAERTYGHAPLGPNGGRVSGEDVEGFVLRSMRGRSRE